MLLRSEIVKYGRKKDGFNCVGKGTLTGNYFKVKIEAGEMPCFLILFHAVQALWNTFRNCSAPLFY